MIAALMSKSLPPYHKVFSLSRPFYRKNPVLTMQVTAKMSSCGHSLENRRLFPYAERVESNLDRKEAAYVEHDCLRRRRSRSGNS